MRVSIVKGYATGVHDPSQLNQTALLHELYLLDWKAFNLTAVLPDGTSGLCVGYWMLAG